MVSGQYPAGAQLFIVSSYQSRPLKMRTVKHEPGVLTGISPLTMLNLTALSRWLFMDFYFNR